MVVRIAETKEVTACGVGCGGGGNGAMSYVGGGHGSYVQETTFKYVGYGGDFDVVRPRRDFTCIITSCCLLSLLLLLPLLLWLLSSLSTSSLPFDCDDGFVNWQNLWSAEQQDYCCMTTGRGCTTIPSTAFPETQPPTSPPTPPPTPPITRPPQPPGPVDPNCAVGAIPTWGAWKRDWCCQHHHVGCPPTAPPVTMPPPLPPLPPMTPPPRPADPYNCADGFANWVAGWSVGKKAWCCRVHGKGCPGAAGGCETSAPYDCNAGFANWVVVGQSGKRHGAASMVVRAAQPQQQVALRWIASSRSVGDMNQLFQALMQGIIFRRRCWTVQSGRVSRVE